MEGTHKARHLVDEGLLTRRPELSGLASVLPPLDDDTMIVLGGESPEPPPKKKQRKNDKEPDVLSEVTLPPLPDTSGAPCAFEGLPVENALVGVDNGRLIIDVDALGWLVQFLVREVALAGVAPVKPPENQLEAKDAYIWWDFTNDKWSGKAKDPQSVWLVRKGPVKRRMSGDLSALSFEQAKDRVYGRWSFGARRSRGRNSRSEWGRLKIN